MAGDPNKASIWADADVYVAFDLEAALPSTIDDEFDEDWELTGLLDGDAGFAETRNEDVTKHYAWGYGAIRTSRKNFELSVGFTLLEDNETSRKLVWPGSGTGEIIVPKPAKVLIAFQTIDGDRILRKISKNYAEVAISADVVRKQDDLTKYPFTATIYPDSSKVLFVEQEGTLASA